LQVERPEEIAEHIRHALKHIPAERLVISSDCGMGREGMSRRHAFYKTVSLVLGTNIVRKELGLPQAEVLAADPRYSLVPPALTDSKVMTSASTLLSVSSASL
jgi:5-methyltetrahydropteroyltriglutamate--homocysteine methyltransferase